MKHSLSFLFLLITLFGFSQTTDISKMAGLSFTAPSKEYTSNPMPAVTQINANWIAVIPFGFTRKNQPFVKYNIDWQWWGEREDGVRETIRLAKEEGLQVMLKPQVYIPGSWPGDLDFNSTEDWSAWETDYESFILFFTAIAEEFNVPLLCIGTEFKKSVKERPEFWRQLIPKIRKQYKGKLVYASNWDNYQDIPFWNLLDYVGIDAYFPLSDQKTPTVKSLVNSWQPIMKKLETFHCTIERPILFTEYGYLSVDRCASKTWELESKVKSLPINELAQANALAALFKSLSEEYWWAGGFIWKWFPNMDGHEGYPERDYTPQGKKAAETLKHWYGKMGDG